MLLKDLLRKFEKAFSQSSMFTWKNLSKNPRGNSSLQLMYFFAPPPSHLQKKLPRYFKSSFPSFPSFRPPKPKHSSAVGANLQHHVFAAWPPDLLQQLGSTTFKALHGNHSVHRLQTSSGGSCCWLLFLVLGCWLLVVVLGSWLLVVGCCDWLLVVVLGSWLL